MTAVCRWRAALPEGKPTFRESTLGTSALRSLHAWQGFFSLLERSGLCRFVPIPHEHSSARRFSKEEINNSASRAAFAHDNVDVFFIGGLPVAPQTRDARREFHAMGNRGQIVTDDVLLARYQIRNEQRGTAHVFGRDRPLRRHALNTKR
jgi:hypothetical protein